MRTLQELINTEDPGWPVVKEWIAAAKNKVEILPCERHQAEEALVYTQVTTRSMMGAIVYETGGLLIDDGWIRVLGAGSDRMKRSLPSWNKGKTFQEYGEPAPYLLVADDILGGLYAINGGFLGKDAGNIYYFAPESLEWMSLEMGYSQFLLFCFESDMDDFYAGMRWKGWRDEIKNLGGDYAYNFAPFLWTKEGKDIESVSRKVMPAQEVYDFNMEMKNVL
ncbi:DUF2625 domain-containing protein [Dysgonomonas sp. 511]|uniref:DUF2625 domain-containing protein n=1 Tax=Dysgonomonas sp. 511 TaxID=2302930 RepID=UPI0013D50A1A|nr:DUF2625 domain-containing protein [Dysgonomonas sp. 511]NDV78370.1 DUF2625 domain-containing protein [Dysgonomonas sp. 511]